MRLTIGTRIAVAVGGLIVLFFGLGWWTLEREYGHELNLVMEGVGPTVTVYEFDNGPSEFEGDEAKTPVFEGSREEAQTYMEQRYAEATNYLGPGLIIGLGALLALASLLPNRRLRSTPS